MVPFATSLVLSAPSPDDVVHPDVNADLAACIWQLLRVHEVGASLQLHDLPLSSPPPAG
jgi:hypothetical protein